MTCLLSSHSVAGSSFSILSSARFPGVRLSLCQQERAALSIIPEWRQRRNKERSALHPGHDHEELRDAGFVVATSVAFAPFA